MTADNKNKKGPVTEADDEPTSEMESLNAAASRADPSDEDFGEIESDEDTFDFDRLDSTSEASSESVAALQSDIKLRNERINRLQFDIEQLRARWTGLEKEIRVREEMTDHLNAELAATKQKLSRTESLLSSREKDIDALQKKLFNQTGRLESFEEEARHVSQTVQAGRSVIEELQDTVTRQQGQLRKLSREHDAALHAREKAEKRDQALEDSNAELHAQLEQQAAQLLEAAGENEKLRHELAQRNKEEASRTDASSTLHDSRAAIESAPPELRAILSDNALLIDQLKQQIARTEQYADTLRRRLIDAADATDREQHNRVRLEHSIADARESIAALRKDLEAEKRRSAELQREAEQASEKFAQELRQVRFELGDAQATLADQETVNERLASDLLDHQGYREALEQQLTKVQKERDRSVTRLERRTRQLEQVNEELERKLESKENAIAALLGELASRSRTIESLGEIENVIHEIDGRMSDRIDEKGDGDKDRLARLLIGNVGGQELQFPLFKPRLTIGRTANNDIQLRAQFISRRHALIITENETTRIVDWGSKNGVYVNDSRVAEQVLSNGDIVAIGTAEFRYEERIKR